MDLVSSNLQATNAKYNSILSKLESAEADVLSNLETTASTATSAISAQLADVTSELRTLVPEGLSVPNINLQAQLQSLSGVTDVTQSANLLSSISTNFGSALTAGGFDLDSLVSSASDAVGSGTSLSGLIPNFEMSADGLGDAIQKASGVKLPDIDPVIEEVAAFTENDDFTAAKTAATNAVYTTYDTFPTEDTGPFKLSDLFKNITQSQGGISITKKVTTATQAYENDTRKTITANGFSNRVGTISEKFTTSDMEEIEGDKVVTLKREPIKIEKVKGKTITAESGQTEFDFRNSANLQGFMIESLGGTYKKDVYSIYLLNNKQVVIKQDYRQYDGTPWAIKITYKYNETYDPTYAVIAT